MKVLELFSGTGSVGKVCKKKGWDVISVDLIFESTHKVDILKWDYKKYDKNEFNIIWASPVCTEYSHLKKCWLGRKMKDGTTYTKEVREQKMNESDLLVLKTLEIIKYFNPRFWFIENPETSEMKNRDMMKGLPFYTVDYCKYSDWGYRKRTRIWTNIKGFKPLVCKKDCENMVTIKNKTLHKDNLGNTERRKLTQKHRNECSRNNTQYQRYRIPEKLIESLFENIENENEE